MVVYGKIISPMGKNTVGKGDQDCTCGCARGWVVVVDFNKVAWVSLTEKRFGGKKPFSHPFSRKGEHCR